MAAYRSRLEERLARWLELNDVSFQYETLNLSYTITANYTPDFVLQNGVILDAKGYFKTADLRKMLAVKKDNPDLDIRFVFQAPFNTLSKESKTTYAMWAEKNDFKWCSSSDIPLSWIE